MLGILWIMMLCMSAGAHQRRNFTEDEVMAIVQSLYKKYANVSTEEYLFETTASSQNSHGWSTTETTSPSYEASEIEHTQSSSESSHEWSTTETTSPNYEASETEPTQSSSQSSHEWSKTETASLDYEIIQTDESEEYAQADQPGGHPIRIGSIRGIPGINFPDYTDIPLTSFSCSNKVHIPGFYADMETGCQVFHVCWPHRRESFLCPIGTTFNQAILTCDYWYSSNCSLASHYYDINAEFFQTGAEYKQYSTLGSMVDSLLEEDLPKSTLTHSTKGASNTDLSYILKFLPVKSKVSSYQSSKETQPEIVTEASIGRGKEAKDREEFKPRYTSDLPPIQRKETPFPKVPTPTIKPEHTHRVDPVNRVIDAIFHIAKKILEELGLPHHPSSMGGDKKEQEPGIVKRIPLPKLNPRFITKPAVIPKSDGKYEKSTARPVGVTKSSKPHVQPIQNPSSDSLKKQYKHASPSTKKILTQNYLKMLKPWY